MIYFYSSLLPAEGQTIFWDYFTIAFVAILVISLFVGLGKGLLGSLVGFLKGVVSFALSIYLSKPIGTALYNTSAGPALTNKINAWISTKGEVFSKTIESADQKEAVVTEALSSLNIPEMFQKFLNSFICKMIPDETGSNTVGLYISQGFAKYILIGVAFIIVAICLSIIFSILKKISKKINKVPVIGFINRLGGAIFGLAFGLVIVLGITYIMSFIYTSNDSINNFITTQLQLTDDTKWSFAKMLFEHNFVSEIIQKYFVK